MSADRGFVFSERRVPIANSPSTRACGECWCISGLAVDAGFIQLFLTLRQSLCVGLLDVRVYGGTWSRTSCIRLSLAGGLHGRCRVAIARPSSGALSLCLIACVSLGQGDSGPTRALAAKDIAGRVLLTLQVVSTGALQRWATEPTDMESIIGIGLGIQLSMQARQRIPRGSSCFV